MIKDKLPDGFPVEQDEPMDDYPCDNCGDHFNANKDAIQASGRANDGEPYHVYDFCSAGCAWEFARDNGLVLHRSDDNTTDYDLTLAQDGEKPGYASETNEPTTADPVAAAVKSIDLGEPTESEQTDAAAEQPTTDIHERKAAECLKEVVKQAMEINDLASKIASEKEYLKGLQKEYKTLVKRQNDYILANANGIQLTFDDCDKDTVPQPKADEEAGQQDDADSLAWRDEPVTTLANYGLTEKQADKAQEAFGTLGRLQDWLCSDYRDKQPGIGQALQDKLTDALNEYTETVYADAKADAEAKTETEEATE